jgi:hypothetical protein
MNRKLSGWGLSAVAVLAVSAGFVAFHNGTASSPARVSSALAQAFDDGTGPYPPPHVPPVAMFADGTGPYPPPHVPPMAALDDGTGPYPPPHVPPQAS